jgi:hypothetical protein
MQGPPSGPLNPLLHLQLPKAVLALFEKEFMGHTEQFAEPIVVLKKPAKHALQGPPSAPLCPLLH